MTRPHSPRARAPKRAPKVRDRRDAGASVEDKEASEEVEVEAIDPGSVRAYEAVEAEIVEDGDAPQERAERASDAPSEHAVVPAGDAGLAGALVPVDSLQRYLAEIRRYPLLDVKEEHDLAVRWREGGDRDAAIGLVTANLRLVVMLARQYQRSFKNLLDLIQEGNIGLLEAVKNYDPYRGVRFPSYAVWWIRA